MKHHPGPGRGVARVPAPDTEAAAAGLPGSRSDIQAGAGSCGTPAVRSRVHPCCPAAAGDSRRGQGPDAGAAIRLDGGLKRQ
jgi:hypothetical protein